MDNVKANNERKLTSTMGNVLSVSSKEEKNDTSDATPTSSTDANTTATATRVVSDDPISSTSSDSIELNKSKATEGNMHNSLEVSETGVDNSDKPTSVDPEADLLEMSISNVSNEKITEDVEDLVHDLESLLGESTDSFNIPIKRKEDRKSPDENEYPGNVIKSPVVKGDGESLNENEVTNYPQTSLEEVQEVMPSDEPISDQTADTKTDESISDRNVLSVFSPAKPPEPEIQENKLVQVKVPHESNIDENNKTSCEETNKVTVGQNEKRINKQINDMPLMWTKDEENSFVSDDSVDNKRIEVIEQKSDGGVEEIAENIIESNMRVAIECAMTSKNTVGNIEKTNKNEDNKQADKVDGRINVKEVVKEPETEHIQMVEENSERKDQVEDKSKDTEIEKNKNTLLQDSKDVSEIEILSVMEDISSDHQPQENELKDTVEEVTSVPKQNIFGDVETESADTIDLINCDKDVKFGQESFKDNEQSKQEEVDEEAVEESPKDETVDAIEIKKIDTENTEKENYGIVEESLSEDHHELLSLDTESEIKEQSVTHNEVVVVFTSISNFEQCKEGCGQVDGTVTENEENKSQSETGLDTETGKYEAVGDFELEISSENKGEEPFELVTENQDKKIEIAGKESTKEEKLDNVANISEPESQTHIPESTVEVVPEHTEFKLENIVSPNDPVGSSMEVIEDAQCSITQDTDEAPSVQCIEETSNPEKIEFSDQPSTKIETSVCPAVGNITPIEMSTEDVESPITIENKKNVDTILKMGQMGDENVELVQTEGENVQSSSEFTMEIFEEVAYAENRKSANNVPNESTNEEVVKQSELETRVEWAGSSKESAEDSEDTAVKQDVYPETQSEKLTEGVPIVEVQSKVTEAKKFYQTKDQLMEKNFADETHEVFTMEAVVQDKEDLSTAKIVAHVDNPTMSENDPVNTQSEDIAESVKQVTESEIEYKTIISNDEYQKLTDEKSISSSTCYVATEEVSSFKEPLAPTNEPPRTKIEVSNSADKYSKAAEKTSDFDDDTLKSAEETLNPNEEVSKPDVETFEADSGSSKLDSESHEMTENMPETECSIGITQGQNIQDAVKLHEIMKATVDLTEENNREKSSSQKMVVEQTQADKKDNNKVIEISDDDSKAAGGDADCIQILSSSLNSNSEEMVSVLALEPDVNISSPKEPIAGSDDTEIEDSSMEVHSSDVSDEPLPEIEDILTDERRVDEATVAIDIQDNLETILAVASLQDAEKSKLAMETIVESEMSEKEKREMEALRKAVESITENTTDDFEDDIDEVVVELIREVAVPEEESEPVDKPEDLPQEASPELADDKSATREVDVDKTESEVKEADTVEDIINEDIAEESVEKPQVVKDNSVDDNIVDSKIDLEAEEKCQALPDTSEDKVIDIEIKQLETKDVLPDSSQGVSVSDEVFREKETKIKGNERPKRHKKSSTDNKLEELSISVDVPDKEKPYSPKVTIKPIKIPDEEVSTTSNSDSEIGKGSLKMTITKQSDKMHTILKICDPENSEVNQEQDEPIPKLIIKPKMQQVEQQHSPKMSTRSSRQVYSPTSFTQRSGSPRITIKPVVKPEKTESVSPLKIKIKSEETSKKHNPKVSIKPVTRPDEEVVRENQSPRKVIIKPVVKPAEEPEQVHNPRITIKPIPKPDVENESTPITPKLNIKPIKKQEDDDSEVDRERSSPKITIKPVVKPQEPDTQTAEGDEEIKERIVLKINKGNLPTPTKDTKKREHPLDDEKSEKLAKITVKFSKGGGHPHIVQQPEESNKRTHEEQVSPEKIKKQKTEIESPISTRSRHKEIVAEAPVEMRSKHKEVTIENPVGDLTKMKQKETESVHESSKTKHKEQFTESPIESKRTKVKETTTEIPVYESTRSRHKDTVSDAQLCEAAKSKHKESNILEKTESNNDSNDDVKVVETKMDSPIVISEDSRSQDSGSCVLIVEEMKDPLSAIPVFEITAESAKAMVAKPEIVSSTPSTPPTPTPRKRGRPRKVPIVVREDFKEQEEPSKSPKGEGLQAAPESGRPKRSCRGQSARATLGIKPRKPRGPGRGRGSKRGMGTRSVPMKPEGEAKLSKAKLKLMQKSVKELAKTAELTRKEKKTLKDLEGVLASNVGIGLAPPDVASSEILASPFTIFPVPSPQGPAASSASGASPKPSNPLLTTEVLDSTAGIPTAIATTTGTESSELVMVDEETRMSAETNSRAQTPAKQIVPADAVLEESQSSVQSTATTESGKAPSSRPNKAPRLEVQEPEGAVISADQLTEYYWNGNGPFMLQEQVAQFLGIKSFKRKYPGIMRRMLEMQERDFIRESGLASEHMCDLGLTAVNSADILDIMYSDFQDKYEEYCKHQRDRQAKDLINKQKALTLAASQEKNKADITEQAVQSAAQWNASFNKTRKEQRKACMDLQTLTVHFPKGKMKQINKTKVGNYPVALVPGQFTDYYQEFTPTEINNLPINTMCYEPINIIPLEESDDSGSDGSDSDSDSSSSSSGSGSDSSSGVEDCKLCKHSPKKVATTK